MGAAAEHRGNRLVTAQIDAAKKGFGAILFDDLLTVSRAYNGHVPFQGGVIRIGAGTNPFCLMNKEATGWASNCLRLPHALGALPGLADRDHGTRARPALRIPAVRTAARGPRVTRPRKPDSRRAYRDERNGAGYDTFRTGLTFRAVRRMMAGSSADPSTWRCRNRRAVLGFWHELKQQLWAQVQDAQEGSR